MKLIREETGLKTDLKDEALRYLKIISLTIITALFSVNTHAYLACKAVPLKIQTSNSASFHGFSEVGLKGNALFVLVPASTCQGYSGDEAGSIIYMVIDDIENSQGIKNVWISMLLAAEARGTTIDFHATVKGTNSRGFQVVTPYFLGSH